MKNTTEGAARRRSFFLLLMVHVLFASSSLSETYYAKRKSNALREGAGAYYSLVASVAENTALLVLARSGSWVKVQLPDRQVGWMSANSLKAEPAGPAVAGSRKPLWSSPRALTAAIKGFGERYGKGKPAVVDALLLSSEKRFTAEDLAAFEQELQHSPSGNRGRIEIEDLDLPTPEYYPDLPEQQIGVDIGARLAGTGVVSDSLLHRYLNMICATITQRSPLYDVDFTVLVLNDRRINAYAVPGGYVFVTLGLLKQCADESELAGVIAHEVAHVYRRHGLQEMSRRIAAIRSDMAFRELEEDVGEDTEEEKELESLLDQTYEKIVHPRLLTYELEADKIGAVFAADAGYDPFGLVRISARVARVSAESPDIFDVDYMLPNDAVRRAEEIRAFAQQHFESDMPGEQMKSRFAAATSHLQ